jgi:amylosucrase
VALSTGGIPLIYLGDEVGTLNDHGFVEDPARSDDSRWVHRPRRDEVRYAQRHDATSAPGRVHAGLRRLIDVRRATPALGGGRLVGFRSGNPHVLGYLRGEGAQRVLALVNFSEQPQHLLPVVFSGGVPSGHELLSGQHVVLRQGLRMAAYEVSWLHWPSGE